MNTNIRRVQRVTVPSVCLGFALVCVPLGCAPAPEETLAAAGDDHSHEEADEGLAPVSITQFSEELGLFLEYSRLYPGVDARFLAHFTVLATGSALEGGSVSLELSAIGGTSHVVTAEKPTSPGVFIPRWTPTEPGTYSARLVVQSTGIDATIELPEVVVHEDLAQAESAAHDEAHAGSGPPADAVAFLMEQQWNIGLRTELVERRDLREELRVNGEVARPNHDLAHVNAPLAGRLLPPAGGSTPKLGDAVVAGQELGRIQPPLSMGDRAQNVSNHLAQASMAMDIKLREVDLAVKQLDVRAAIQETEASLLFANKTLDRIAKLREKELGTVGQFERAQLDKETAVSKLAGLKKQEEAFAETEIPLADLRAGLEEFHGTGALESAPTLSLRAPISGVINGIHRAVGESIGQSTTVWEIMDTERVWVLAHVSEFDLSRLPANPPARVQFADDASSSTPLGGLVPRFLSTVDRDSRTLALTYELQDPAKNLVSGMGADVYVELGRAINAASIPVEAIVKEDGRPVAYVLVDGETFQKRELTLGMHSGRYVEILEGLRSGERIVTRGAYLLKLASAAPASFGHGHAH